MSYQVSCMVLLLLRSVVGTHAEEDRLNVLLIMVDDLRPELGVYSDSQPGVHPGIQSPNIDRLAEDSLVLRRAYLQQALCGPSRTSLLTGRRPDTTRVHINHRYWREVAGNFTTLPQHFKDSGYVSIGMGKVFHPGLGSGDNDPLSWSEPYYNPPLCCGRESSWRAIPKQEVELNPLSDMLSTNEAIRTLNRFAPGGDLEGENFFLAVGFNRPHMPFAVPEQYFEYYPPDTIELAEHPYAPVGMPEVAWPKLQEMPRYDDIKLLNFTGAINETMPYFKAVELRRAYYACVTYIDDLVGQILAELDQLNMANTTVVVFLGDHGFKLGEHSGWGKHDNFELSARVPMILRIPSLTDGGIVSEQLAELVDLFPTLVEIVGLPPLDLCPEDSADINLCVEGTSLMPLVYGLSSSSNATWKDRVFTQDPQDENSVMGYTIRTEHYRYTEWVAFNESIWQSDWDDIRGVELYEPNEVINVAYDPDYAEVRAELSVLLRKGWRDAVPKK